MVNSFKSSSKVKERSACVPRSKNEAKVIKLIFTFFSISLILLGGNIFTTGYSQPQQVLPEANQQVQKEEEQQYLDFELQQQQVSQMTEEVSSNYSSSSIERSSSNTNSGGTVKKNMQIFNQDNRSNATGRFVLNDAIDLSQNKNETRVLMNITNSNINSGSNTAALGSSSKVSGDFNGDGFEDKAIGVPYEDLESPTGIIPDAGIVQVIYGSSGGLSTSTVLLDQLLKQDSLDNGGIPEEGDRFGQSLSTGDYNGDGFDDLAIGVPGEDIDLAVATIGNFDVNTNSIRLRQDVGVVQVIYGSGQGLSSAVLHHQIKVFIQGFDFLFEAAEFRDRFGTSLTSGNFNGDKNPITGKDIDDLAVGVPYEDPHRQDGSSVEDAGMIQIIYGSQLAGLDTNQAVHDHAFWQGWNHIVDQIDEGEFFGWSLTSGDFNGDGFDDLAVGVIGEGRQLGVDDAGAVSVIYGSSWGLSSTTPVFNEMYQQGFGNADGPETGDFFGWSLSSGDYNGDGKDDLAIGIPYEGIGVESESEGAVNVIYGSSNGLSLAGNQLWEQGQNGLDDIPESFDHFGYSLTSSDFNGDGKGDLAIGVPLESVNGGTVEYAGKVHVVYGSSGGLSATPPLADQLWQQGLNGVDDGPEEQDHFGQSLTSGDFNGDGKGDLVIGVPLESVNGGTVHLAGKLHVIYGSPSGLSTTSPLADQLWQQGLNGLDDVSEFFDALGWFL